MVKPLYGESLLVAKSIAELLAPMVTEKDATMVKVFGDKSHASDSMKDLISAIDSIKNRYKDPGALESFEKFVNEKMFDMESEVGGSYTQEDYESRKKATADLWRIAGSPYLKTFDVKTPGFRPHYGKGEPQAPDTLYIREGELVDMIEELTHSYAYNQPEYGREAEKYGYKQYPAQNFPFTNIVEDSPDPSYDPEYRKEREGAAREEWGKEIESILGGLVDSYIVEDKGRYETPGTVEWEAHKVLEPLLYKYLAPKLGLTK
jgi:hypothetical protein